MPDDTRNGEGHSEVARGVRAAVLGAILGVVLVALARSRAQGPQIVK